MSSSISARFDSPMPRTFSVWDLIIPKWGKRCSKYGNNSCSQTCCNSKGGPGSMMNVVLPCSSTSPGAVPTALCKTMAPLGTRACFSLLDAIQMFRLDNRSWIWFHTSRFIYISTPQYSATSSLVISPRVGPSPPLVMTISARPAAISSTSFMRAGLSPTVV